MAFLDQHLLILRKQLVAIPSEIPKEMDDLTDSLLPPGVKKVPSKSHPTDTLPEGFDPSKFLSPLYKPAGKAKKENN